MPTMDTIYVLTHPDTIGQDMAATFEGHDPREYQPLTDAIISEELSGWLQNGWAYATEAEALTAAEAAPEGTRLQVLPIDATLMRDLIQLHVLP